MAAPMTKSEIEIEIDTLKRRVVELTNAVRQMETNGQRWARKGTYQILKRKLADADVRLAVLTARL